MTRVLCIDFGLKRIGLAVTDPLKIAAHGLDTIPSEQIEDFLDSYLGKEEVETIVIGDPFTEGVFDEELHTGIENLIKFIRESYPGVAIARQDEGFSSVMAKEAILKGGAGQKKRRDKALVDKISAVIILQHYLGHL